MPKIDELKPDQVPDLDDLIDRISGYMQRRDLSDEYLLDNGDMDRTTGGIGEYVYGISMVACSWVYPYLEELMHSRQEMDWMIADRKHLDERLQWTRNQLEIARRRNKGTDISSADYHLALTDIVDRCAARRTVHLAEGGRGVSRVIDEKGTRANLRALRTKHHISVETLAEKLGASKWTVYGWEERRPPSLYWLVKLAWLYGVKIDDIISVKTEKN